ncbi:MAG: rhodanese-like domain-containing protein [Campylobacterota bacterium]|nr:rhodanese-like domain-containing protein [Campylobacterota bacterium]
MQKYILSAFILFLLLSVNAYAGKMMTQSAQKLMKEAQKEIHSVTPKEFKQLIDDDAEFIQLDVRENNQYGHGEIWTMEMVKLTRGYVEYKVEHAIPNKKTKIVVICCSGKRAVLAAKTMKSLGYTNVEYLQGGVNGWLQAGYPLDTVFGELYLKP